MEHLVAPTFLFRFASPLRKHAWPGDLEKLTLGEEHTLPSFGELEGKPVFASLRGAWSKEGLAFSLRVAGKRQIAWCRPARLEDSDGLQLWIDTRATQNIHRAGRFCHRFVLLPFGSGRRLDEPTAQLALINRAKESPRSLPTGLLQARSQNRPDGYTLDAFIPATALTGYDPAEHPRLGFTYAVVDRELGWQTFTIGPEFPFTEDPSLWGTLDLVS